MGASIFGYARFGSTVFAAYGLAEITPPSPVTSDVIRTMTADFRRMIAMDGLVRGQSNSSAQFRTNVSTTIER
jgi:hypothetical protein